MKKLIKLIFVLTLSVLLYNCANNTDDIIETNQVLTPADVNIPVAKQNIGVNEFTTLVADPCDGVAEFNGDSSSYSIGDTVTFLGSLYVKVADGWDYLGPCGTGGGPCDGVDAYNGDDSSYAVGDLMVYKGVLYERTASGWNSLGPCSGGGS
jgi:hypothetical protein